MSARALSNMPPLTTVLSIIFFLLQVGSATFIPFRNRLSDRSIVLQPSIDPFYKPTSDFETQKPGSILRARTVDSLAFASTVPFNPKAVYQLLFRSTDSLGNPSTAVSTVIIPHNANSTRLLSYQTAEDAAWADCAPSYTFQLNSTRNIGGGDTSTLELLLIVAALDQGWVVSVPDYEGPTAAYMSGIQAGQATLDSVRAALSSGLLTDISPDAEAQLWGYSGGAFATEWAAELQPSYAPELNFIGAAYGGVTPSIASVFLTINGGNSAGLIPTGVLGLAQAYPELDTWTNQHLIPATASYFRRPLSQCENDNTKDFSGQNIFSYIDVGEDFISDPVVQSVLNVTGDMGIHGTPKMPMYIYKAVGDEISNITDTDTFVKKMCDQGARIQYVRDSFGDHGSEAITGSGDAFNFLKDRFSGIPVANFCSTKTVSDDLFDPGALAALGNTVVDLLLSLLQLPVGPI